MHYDKHDGCPTPGSLQTLGIRITENWSERSVPMLDALVTSYIRHGIVVGFRFLRQDEDYKSPHAANAMFTLTSSLLPGTFLRLEDSGKSLLSYESLHGIGDGKVVGTSCAAVNVSRNSSCFIFWAPNPALAVEGISFIGFRAEGGLCALTPSECSLPCEFITIMDLPETKTFSCDCDCSVSTNSSSDISSSQTEDSSTDSSSSTSSSSFEAKHVSYMVFAGSRRAISGTWVHAWLQFKYAAAGGKWKNSSLHSYDSAVEDLARSLFVCPLPGQLIPLAYRPCAVSEKRDRRDEQEIFPAQLAVLVTSPIPPRTNVWIVPNCSNESSVREEALWLWTSPCKAWVPAGVTITYYSLAYDRQPRASIGKISKSGLWPTRRFSIEAFTLYGMAREVPSSGACVVSEPLAYAITSVYTCNYGCELPSGLVPGESISSRPWPCHAAVLPVENCRARGIPRDWLFEKLKLLRTSPVRWICQSVPSFRRLEPRRDCLEVETSPTIGVMSGSGCASDLKDTVHQSWRGF